MNPPKEEDIRPEEVRGAQKAIGELLWLSTPDQTSPLWCRSAVSRSWPHRDDILCGMGVSPRNCTDHGLWFLKETGMNWEEGSPAGLETYSDISYSPHTEISHGAVYVTWKKSLMWWRSSRQPFPTMSSIDTLIVEHEEPRPCQTTSGRQCSGSLAAAGWSDFMGDTPRI